MTTLPQTTPIRMPRPAAAPQSTPMVSMPGMGHTPAMPAPQHGLSLADAWRVVRGHAWLIVAFVALSAVGGYYLNQYLARNHSKFTAQGLIQYTPTLNYDPVHNPNPSLDANTFNMELATMAQILRNEQLITKVLTDPNKELRRTAWFGQFPSAAAARTALVKDYSVSPVPGTRLISIQVTTPIARDSRIIVEDIGNQFIADQKQDQINKNTDRGTALNLRKKELEGKRNEKQAQIRERSVRLTQAGFDVNTNTNSLKAEENNLAATISGAMAELTALRARYDQMAAKINEGQDPPELIAAVENDPTISGLREAIRAIDMERDLSNGGPELPRIKTLMARRDAYAKKLEELRGEKLANLRLGTLDGLRNAIATIAQRIETVNTRYEAVKQQNTDLASIYRQYDLLRAEEASLTSEIKEITQSLDQIAQVNKVDAGGVNWSTRPTTPDSPSFPKLPVTMAMSIMAGLGLALGIAFLRELTDTSVRSPRDISRIGSLNLLGMVSDINDDPQSAGAKLPLAIFEAPHAILAEQFRQVRTRMQHAASLDSTRSILITSPGAGDGKSTVACNLAAGLALNGRRILLVDANFRRPELHKVFNLTNDIGFADVLNHLDTLPQAIRESQVPNLAVLTSGAKPVNATELFESQLLVDFIEKALEEFDHVVFDSGPLLVVSETVALAPRVDGVVTVVRARHNSRGLLVRMRDTLRQLKAEHLGVILNGVRAQGGGYYGRNIKAYYAYMDDDTRALPVRETSGAA